MTPPAWRDLLDPDVFDRVDAAVNQLIHLRRVRVGAQHSDARHKAVAAFEQLGLSYPPISWPAVWTEVSLLARGSLDVIREEVHSSLRDV